MERSTLLVRADASSEIGMGHIMRCIALGQYWLANIGDVHFACRQIPETLKQRLATENFKLHCLRSAQSAELEALELRHLSSQLKADAVVLDGYQFDDHYQTTALDGEAISLVLDDHQHAKHNAADCVVNLNLGAEAFDYGEIPAKLLLGADYSLIRQEFIAAARSKTLFCARDKNEVSNVLVTLGGSDPTNATYWVADSLIRNCSLANWKVRLLLGSGYRYLETLEPLVKHQPAIEMVQSMEDVSPLYQWADIAICAGGGSNWEMSLFGIPRVVIPVAANQIPSTKAMAERGCCWIAEPDDATGLVEKVMALAEQPNDRDKMAEKSRQLVDGQGSCRISDALLELIHEKNHGSKSI